LSRARSSHLDVIGAALTPRVQATAIFATGSVWFEMVSHCRKTKQKG
jgi:hypothetical protein